jgi:hypothetical protein
MVVIIQQITGMIPPITHTELMKISILSYMRCTTFLVEHLSRTQSRPRMWSKVLIVHQTNPLAPPLVGVDFKPEITRSITGGG